MISPQELRNQLLEGIDSNTSLKSLPIDIQDVVCSRIGIAFSEYYDDLVLALVIFDIAQELSPKMTIISFARIIELSKHAFDETIDALNLRTPLVEKYWKETLDYHVCLRKGDRFGLEWRYN